MGNDVTHSCEFDPAREAPMIALRHEKRRTRKEPAFYPGTVI